jgi:hypothetical protein
LGDASLEIINHQSSNHQSKCWEEGSHALAVTEFVEDAGEDPGKRVRLAIEVAEHSLAIVVGSLPDEAEAETGSPASFLAMRRRWEKSAEETGLFAST